MKLKWAVMWKVSKARSPIGAIQVDSAVRGGPELKKHPCFSEGM